MPEIRNITHIGKSRMLNQKPLTMPRPWPRCASTITFMLKLPAHRTTQIRMKPIETS